MGAIFEFKAKPKKPEPPVKHKDMVYYCMQCEGDKFVLFQNMWIHCASCGFQMRNIMVLRTSSAPKEPA